LKDCLSKVIAEKSTGITKAEVICLEDKIMSISFSYKPCVNWCYPMAITSSDYQAFQTTLLLEIYLIYIKTYKAYTCVIPNDRFDVSIRHAFIYFESEDNIIAANIGHDFVYNINNKLENMIHMLIQ